MNILGLNAFHADTSAAVLVDGHLVAAAEEERFTRVKHDTSFPVRAIEYCLREANLRIGDIDHIAISRDPWANFPRKLLFAWTNRAGRRMAPQRVGVFRSVLRLRDTMARALDISSYEIRAEVHFVEHHLAHIASSFFCSPFERAAVCSIDGFGDMVSGMWGTGEGSLLRITGEAAFPHSLGVFYTALTQYLGFHSFGDEYKVMGLASYGEPEHIEQMRRIVRSKGIGYELDLDCFRHHIEGASMTWDGGAPELGPLFSDELAARLGPARSGPDEPVEKRHENIASSLQARLEEIVLPMLEKLHARTRCDALCLSGGVALNCVVNGKVLSQTPFRDLYIQPAANDSGTSIGAAFHVFNHVLGGPRGYVMDNAYLGPSSSASECRAALESADVCYERLQQDELLARTARAIADGKVVGWFQGRMEFGPRALGNRSILADPRRHDMKDILNARVKHREPFRPFAPSILEEATGDWFERSDPSPFMLLTYPVRAGRAAEIPAPTHVDGTGRLQTVRRDQNPLYYDLIKAFDRLTGVPVLLNTSFNENEPICCLPEQAVDCFQRTRMDVLVLGDLLAEEPSEAAAEI